MKYYNNFNEMFSANVSTCNTLSVFNNMETLCGTAHLYHFKVVPTKNAPKTKTYNLMPTRLDEFKKAVDIIMETSKRNDGFVYKNSPIEMWGNNNIQLTPTQHWAEECYDYINRMTQNNGYKFCSISSRKERNSDNNTARVSFYDTDNNIIAATSCPQFYADNADLIAENLGNIIPTAFHKSLGYMEDTLKADDEMIRYTISFSKKCQEYLKLAKDTEQAKAEMYPETKEEELTPTVNPSTLKPVPSQQLFPFLNN